MSRSDDDRSLSHASGVAKNYGTVTTRVNPGYVEHAVQKTDTLQGIALKYGTTVMSDASHVILSYGVYALYLDRWR